MAVKDSLSTIQDVRNMSEYITTAVRDDARVRQYILRADSVIRDALRPYYAMDSEVEDTPYNGPPQAPFAVPDHDISGNSSDGALSDITVASNAKTEVFTITFTGNTAFSVSGTVSGSQGTGSTASDFTASNSSIVIPAANWSGTFAANDVIKVAVYRAKPLIVTCSALLATGLLLKSSFEGGDGVSARGVDFQTQAEDLIDRLQRPYEDDGLQLDTFSARDLTPEGVAYFVDMVGKDVSRYADNEMTPWIDSRSGGGTLGFFIGPIWVS